jgi:hypothetical protein
MAAVACGGGGGGGGSTETTGTALKGVFRIEAGECGATGVSSGSYFRMVQPGGTVGKGPFVTNGDSPCDDRTWTPMVAGKDGGFVTGGYQANPKPAFDAKGNGTADLITVPQKWFAVGFSLSTNPTDPQTKKSVPPLSILVDGSGQLTGDVSSVSAAWNGQYFNQGSPKPDGSTPGNTSPLTGTYDESSRSFTIQWASQIVGGPFNNFTGVWHFVGTFEST